MYTKPSNAKKPAAPVKNPLETLTDLGSSVVTDTADEFGKIGAGIFDQIMGSYDDEYRSQKDNLKHEEQKKPAKKKEANLFNYNEYHETEVKVQEIKALTDEIKKTLTAVRAEASELVKDAEKLTVEPISEKPGIYHQRFLELILSLLRDLRAKIGESNTWMQAMISKKKKRGSLFAARSKEKGTQYSLSQEMQASRSVQ